MICCVQSLSCVRLFTTPWTAARQASLSFTVSQSLLKLVSIELAKKGEDLPSESQGITIMNTPPEIKHPLHFLIALMNSVTRVIFQNLGLQENSDNKIN